MQIFIGSYHELEEGETKPPPLKIFDFIVKKWYFCLFLASGWGCLPAAPFPLDTPLVKNRLLWGTQSLLVVFLGSQKHYYFTFVAYRFAVIWSFNGFTADLNLFYTGGKYAPSQFFLIPPKPFNFLRWSHFDFEFFYFRTTKKILGRFVLPEMTSSACFSKAPMDFLAFLNLDFV